MAKFEPKTEDSPYASFGARAAAYILDTVLVFLTLSIYAFYWLYRTARYGDSLGKKFMNIKIVTADGSPHLGFGKMLLREFIGRFVDYLFLGIGAFWILIDSDNQAIHDKVAGTYVVKNSALEE